MQILTIRRNNRIIKSDYLFKLLYRGFMAFNDFWEEFLVVSGRVDNTP